MTGAKTRLGLAAVALLAIVALAGCDWLFGGGDIQIILSNRLSGTAVDARASASGTGASGVADVSVTLNTADGVTILFTATSGSDGAFSFSAVDPGTYLLKGSKTGFAFIDKTVNVAAHDADVSVGDMLGFSSATNDISVIAVWSSAFSDIDTHITYPTEDNWTSATTPIFTDLYQDSDGAALVGFFPTSATSDRGHVYFSSRTSTSTVGDFAGTSDTTPAVKLDVDDTNGSGPETMTIKAPPVHATSITFNTTPTTANGLPSGTSYAWIGVMEYYVNSFSTPSISTEGSSGGASVEVYVVQGSSVKARIVVPDYILIETASVLRINLFVSQSTNAAFYQFVPDLRITQDNTYRGLGSGAFVLSGAVR